MVAVLGGVDRPRFHALDGLRGIAALAVLFLHAQAPFERKLGVHGTYAVDLFFIMSGFVVAHAYDAKLKRGWGVPGFMKVRLLRLYPLYGLGLLLGAFAALLIHPVDLVGMIAVLGAFMIPLLIGRDQAVFPLNGPSWSLLCEFVINAGYAALATKLTDLRLVATITAGAAFLLFYGVRDGYFAGGAYTSDFAAGYAQILYCFPAGVLIERLFREGKLAPLARIAPSLLMVVFTVLLLSPHGVEARTYIDVIVVMVVLPLLVACAAQSSVVNRLEQRAYAGIAALSYPLYVIHMPVLNALNGVSTFVHIDGPLFWILRLILPLILAILVTLFFDRPWQTYLSARR